MLFTLHVKFAIFLQNGRMSRFLKGLETRDFFLMLASRVTNLDRVDDNPICLGLPWDENSEHLKKFRQVPYSI